MILLSHSDFSQSNLKLNCALYLPANENRYLIQLID